MDIYDTVYFTGTLKGSMTDLRSELEKIAKDVVVSSNGSTVIGHASSETYRRLFGKVEFKGPIERWKAAEPARIPPELQPYLASVEIDSNDF